MSCHDRIDGVGGNKCTGGAPKKFLWRQFFSDHILESMPEPVDPPESQKEAATDRPSPSPKDVAEESQKKTVWVFGYGSLMWDNWETAHGCLRNVVAVLPGFRRTFNKASVDRWGSRDKPCPTLNLAAEPSASCKGVAFEFPEEKRGEVLDYLTQREAGFDLNEKGIRLKNEDGDSVMAVVPIYAGENLLSEKSLSEVVAMVGPAKGGQGFCIDYVKSVAKKLSDLGIHDLAVEELLRAQKASEAQVPPKDETNKLVDQEPDPLTLSLRDAQLLVAYAVRNNIPEVENAIDTIVTSESLYKGGKLESKAQADFYHAYSTLAAKIAPVTVASLRDSLDEYGVPVKQFFFFGKEEKRSLAARVAGWHKVWALFVVSMLIIAQGYWLVGNGILITLAKPTIDEADLTYRYVVLGGSSTIFPAFAAPSPAASPAETRPVETDSAAWKKNEVAWEFYLRSRWNAATQLVPWLHWLNRGLKIPQKPDREWADKIIAKAGQMNDCLQQLVLPLLYGWLGAMAYILRTVSQQARDRLFRSENQVVWDLRGWLGAVSGLAIGWFCKPSSADVNGLGLISPFALAFVAGYSVDLLFTAMDRIVSAFSGPGPKTPETSSKPPLPKP
jgi:glutathione-specific gamma-glutamylcyclotransferase